MNKEIRSINNIEIRELGDNNKEIHIQGYALTFDTISEDLGFRETIHKGALDNCDMSNVVLNFNHDDDKILARNNKNTGIGSLILTIDEKGLFFDAIPTDTSYGKDLIENMQNGVINKCSFAFTLDYSVSDSQKWEWDNGSKGYDLRHIYKIAKIFDVSVVTNPAYESTESLVYTRAKDDKEKQQKLNEIRKYIEEVENELQK